MRLYLHYKFIRKYSITAIIVSSAKMSNADLRKAVLHCDTERLTDAVLQQMIKYMPTAEQIQKLQALPANEKADLVDAEKFALEVCSLEKCHFFLISSDFFPIF